jgi:SAM-dependent methyltransferase
MSDRGFLVAIMLEGSLARSRKYIRGRVLDVGCGHRPYEKTYFSGGAQYVGTDYLSDRSKPDIVSSGLALPFTEGSFDTVVSTEVLEHVPDPLAALKEMRRVVRPAGHLVLSAPYYWPRHEVPYDYFRYPYDGFLNLLARANWKVQRLFSRGRSYAFLGQVIQHIHPVRSQIFSRELNRFFLQCDRKLRHDTLTLGWTVVASPSVQTSDAS